METRRLVLTLTGIGVALIVVLGGLSIALFATGGGDEGGQATSGGNNDGNEETPQLPDRVEGELRLFGGDPITLDPACASDADSAVYIVEIFSGLVSFDRELNVIPDVAESIDVSPDGLVYTFHLRKNVVFHDGSRRVVADDFKFSMERALNPDTQSTVGEVYLDDIAGVDEFITGAAEEVSGVKVINDDTLEITIKEPIVYFLDKLTYPTAYVVDRREVGDATCFEGADWTLNPNGTGPFKLKEFVLGQRIELEPNTDFYLDPKPSLQQVTYLLAGGSALVMYENDEIDVTGVGVNDVERIRDPNEPLNAEYQTGANMSTDYIGFNTQEAPFDDPRVRKAFAMATDKQLVAETVLMDILLPAKGILPPGIAGYDETYEGVPYDPEAARALLDEAGGPELFDDVTLLTSGQGAAPSEALAAVTALWEEDLGVSIPIEQEEFGIFLRDIDQGNFKMFSLGWIADYPDPQNFLDIKLHSESSNNETQYSNPEVDALLERARAEKDEAERIRLYQEAERLIVEDSPWVPLFHGQDSVLIKPYVKNYTNAPFVIPRLRYVSIER
ncbi:MAG TPA: peptide ABC transporter substrate-binding protein [Dehalococcoidia bacterium]|nr:peptide ABC transporter substrate-binding protein [Dehalococcoidia bacterium]